MQTVRACCRVLAACAAAFVSFSLEAATLHAAANPTPQNLTAVGAQWGDPVDAWTPTFTPTVDGRSIILNWPAVAGAEKYAIYRSQTASVADTDYVSETTETTYTDSRRYPTQRYTYLIKALAADGTVCASSSFPAYSQLDFLNDDSIEFSPRFPWQGKIDILVQNLTARDKDKDGLPRFKLTATHAGNPLTLQTLTRGDGTVLDPHDFTLDEADPFASREYTRLVWDARADLGEINLTSAIDFKLEYVGLTTEDAKPFEGDRTIDKRGLSEGFDTRLVPEIALDGRTTYIYADVGWWHQAGYVEVCDRNGEQLMVTSGRTARSVRASDLPIWGVNTFTIKTNTGESWTGYIKYPEFTFTVSQGNADGVKLTWNAITGVSQYDIRRRPIGSATFETIRSVRDVTSWTDTVENEVGSFEYTVMPVRPNGLDAGPIPAVSRGFRTLEKAEFTVARSDDPWTPRVVMDIAYASGRVALTDGAVTYRLERTDGGPLTALTNVVGEAVDPANVTLVPGVTNRIWWSAAADLGEGAVVSDMSLRLVATLAADAPSNAVAAPAPVTCEPFAVDFRPTRTVNEGETLVVPWLWTRTDARDEAADEIRIDANISWDDMTKTLLDRAIGTDPRLDTLSFEVTGDFWTSFTLTKHERNGDTDETTTSFVTYKLPTAAPQGLTASQGDTNAVTLAWSAVPYAIGYNITATYADCSHDPAVTDTRSWQTSGNEATNTVDAAAPALGYARYTVRAFYGNGARSPEATAIGWRSLDALTVSSVKTRKPWPSGKVDIDLSYVTARHELNSATGAGVPTELPLALAVRTAEGRTLPVSSLVREPAVDASATSLTRRTLTNNQPFFRDTGAWRIVWDAGTDITDKLLAADAVLTVSLDGAVAATATFDLDTRRQDRLPITEDMGTLPLRWATRWMDEGANLDLGADKSVRLVEIKDGTSRDLFSGSFRDAEGSVDWTPPADIVDSVTVKALYEGVEKEDYTLTFFRAPDVNVRASQNTGDGTIGLKWDAVNDADFGAVSYAVLRRTVGRDGSRSAWTTLAVGVTTTAYDDSVGADSTTVYEYAVRVRYPDGIGGLIDAALPTAAPSADASGWSTTASLALSAPVPGAPWTPTVRVDASYTTGQPVGGAADLVEVVAKDMDGNTNLTVRTLTLDGANVVNGSFTLDAGADTSTGWIVWDAGADVPEANLANVVLIVKTKGSGLERTTTPFALDVRTVRDVAVGETISVPWAWTRTDARDEAADRLVLKANVNGGWNRESLYEAAVGATGPRTGVATVTVTDDLWTSFTLEKYELNGDTDETTTSFVTYKLPTAAPQGLTASQGDTNAVTLAWSAVPYASGYNITATYTDCSHTPVVTDTRSRQTSGDEATNTVDAAAPALGYARYTVTAVYPNEANGPAAAAVTGWRSLDALTVSSVKTRKPWPSGKVDIDLSYVTARHELNSATGAGVPTELPLALAVRTAEGRTLPVSSLVREPAVDASATSLARRTLTNGQPFFDDTGAWRIVWDAGTDITDKLLAADAVLTVSLDGTVVATATFDLDTRRQDRLPITEDMGTLPLRWATRWADEGEGAWSLWMLYDVRLVEETANGTRKLFNQRTRDAEGSVDWTPPADAWGRLTVKATYDGKEYPDYTLTYFRTPEVNVKASQNTGDGKIRVTWSAAPDATHYQVLRRVVNRDGSRGDWVTLADGITTISYDDAVGADDTTVYEYAVRVCYANAADPNAPFVADPSAAASGWSKTARLALSGLTVSDPWDTTVGVGVDFEYVTGQAIGTSDLAEVVVTDADGNTNLTVQTLEMDGTAVVNTAFSLDKGVPTSRGRLVWNAGVDVPRVYLTNVVLQVKTATTGLEETVGPFTLDTCGTRAVFDALGPWLDGGATVVTQEVKDVYGALPTATRAGYRLVGWFDGVTRAARRVLAGMEPLTREDHRLYAKWEVDASVSPVVDADGNSIFRWEATGPTTARILGFRKVNQQIANLIIPDTIDGLVVTEIVAEAFANSTSGMTSLTLPIYCTVVGRRAFSGIKTLTSLTIEPIRDVADPARAGALTIGKYAFTSTGLTEVFLPVEVELIDDYAFADCRMLQNVMILGQPAVGQRPFRRAGLDAGVKPTILLHPDLASDAAYLAQITQDLGRDVTVRTDAIVTGLSLATFAAPAPGHVQLSVGVARAAAWGEVDLSRLRVVYRAQLGDAPTDLVPDRVVQGADGSLTLDVTAPDGPSGFFGVKLLK